MPEVDDVYTGTSADALKRSFLDHLYYSQGKFPAIATSYDLYLAVALSVRDWLLERWIETIDTFQRGDVRAVAYLSAEFLLGPHLDNNLLNLGLTGQAHEAASQLGWNLHEIIDQEPEPGLGNGGLGRLAACYLDSTATLGIPAIGYGIRYEYGIFKQEIQDGWQIEKTDKWLQFGNPWELKRPERAVSICLGGHTEAGLDEQGQYRVRWAPAHTLKAIPYDTPVAGYRTNTTNTIRLWSAEAAESCDFYAFNTGDYLGAVRAKIEGETISKVLYPNDENAQGKELRLEQQFFFTSASLQDMIRIHLGHGRKIEEFNRKWAVQMNDTHPSIAVAELMRLLVDEYQVSWDTAWQVTQSTLGYTNHTLLPEALEKWPISLFGRLLPRHLELIYEINRCFLSDVHAKYPGDLDRIRRMSLIEEGDERYVRMAYLATVGSHAVNGVAALHTELLQKDVLHDFYEMCPAKFSNKTNGVTPRRWIAVSNPHLADLLTSKLGTKWLTDLSELKQLVSFADDAQFQRDWEDRQQAVKRDFSAYLAKLTGIEISPSSLFDVMVKRIHEYKRQHLKVLHILALYKRVKQNPKASVLPRAFIFGGKAAPGYRMAKLIIKLINSVAEVMNNDPDVDGRLKVAFLPNYNVSSGQHVYPAADLSEQISLAGKEASGTGNMKFAMNGAVTIGTLDGANIEIRDEVGSENFFLFGLTAEEISLQRAQGYNPLHIYESDLELKEILDSLASGEFSRGDRQMFRPLLDSLLGSDPYFLLADFRSYLSCQDQIDEAYRDRSRWSKMSILNVAHCGKFSSDRSVHQYAQQIWNVNCI